MKALQVGFLVLFIVLIFIVLIVVGVRAFRSLAGQTPNPSIASNQVGQPSPKVIQTDKQVVIFQNPLVDQVGLPIEEVIDRQNELLGQEITIKGEVGRKERSLGFWMDEAGRGREEIFIVTDGSIANDIVAQFDPTGQKYLNVTGTLKVLIWTDEETLQEASESSRGSLTSSDRLVIVAERITPIEL